MQENQTMQSRIRNAGWFLLPKWLRRFYNTHRIR